MAARHEDYITAVKYDGKNLPPDRRAVPTSHPTDHMASMLVYGYVIPCLICSHSWQDTH